MAIHVNIGDAKTRLSELLAAAKRGEEVIITRAGTPEARLVPVDPDRHRREIAEKRRKFFGSLKGKIADDIDWFAPMSDEERAQWYDGPIFPDVDPDEPAG
ncbi:MAG TPA: type II toxin-antitoxin system prevent-host-death family antitoxin [Allosphingosinicella sp.]|nr:type II toxin-antitoxin system prevent-host-death family antitoxin [Allosphingosinicella sp.]